MNQNEFFSPVSNTKPFVKVGIQGFAGDGKTQTAIRLAIGLHKRINSKKPIVMFDTEKSAQYLKPILAEAGIELLVKESNTFADLKTTMDLVMGGASDILVIDSITHVWENVLESYKEKKKRNFIQFQDWGILKPFWRSEFSNRIIHDRYHTIMCGRAGFEYENEINEDTGRREIYKSGVKMKAEGETAYEPDLLIYMERHEDLLSKDNHRVYRTATVIKDKTSILDGKVFTYEKKDPITKVFDDFEPYVNVVLSAPEKAPEGPKGDTSKLFKTEEDRLNYSKDREIIIEKVEAELYRNHPSTKVPDKQARKDLVEKVFATTSWTEVTELPLSDLKAGLAHLKALNDPDKIASDDPLSSKEIVTMQESMND